MATVTVTTRVSSETATGGVMVFTQADGSAAQAIVPVNAFGSAVSFSNVPNPAYTGTAIQVAVTGMNIDAASPGAVGAFYGLNQFGYFNDAAAVLTAGQTGVVRATASRALHTNLRSSTGTEVSITAAGLLSVNVAAGGGTGGTALTDSTVFTAGSTSVTPIAAYFTDTAAPIGAPQAGGLRMSKWRSLWTTPVTESGVYMTDTTNSAARVSLVTMAQVIGAVAAGSTDTQAPVKTGGYAASVAPVAVSTGQIQNTWTDLVGRTHIIANVSSVFGSLTQPITCTLANLNAGTAVSRSSAAIDNSVNNFLDALVTININGGRPGGNSQALLWAYGSVNGGTNYTERVSGSDAAYAMDNPTNLRYLGTVPMPYNSQVYTGGPFSVAAAFDGMMPPRWGIVVQNDGGFPFMPTNSSAIYVGVARQMI